LECKGIDHYDVFDGDVIIFSVDISGVPEEIRSIAQEIDGCDYDPDCFGMWVNYDFVDKEFYLVTENNYPEVPGDVPSNVFYIDQAADKHWFKTDIPQELLDHIFKECGKVVTDIEKEQAEGQKGNGIMERSYDETILCLPGTAEEKQWLAEHLEVLSVRERTILSAAMAREPPQDMAGAVNCLLSLDEYEVRGHVGSYTALGEFSLFEQCVPQDQQAYFDLTALGYAYEDQHPGLFIGNCYVEYPASQSVMLYDGGELPEAEGWSVRLKLASEAVPAGVWVKLPDYNEVNNDGPGEIRLALDELRVKTIQECTLLDARCVLPCVQNLAGQYDNLADLVYDGQELGILLDKRGQGSPDFLERFSAALELESCRRLYDALNIASSLNGYDYISKDRFLDKVTEEVNGQEWAKGGDAVKGCFDYAAYAAALAEQQGYQTTADGLNYIRKRDSPVLEQQQGGMIMQ
jgi:hypothetical protein